MGTHSQEEGAPMTSNFLFSLPFEMAAFAPVSLFSLKINRHWRATFISPTSVLPRKKRRADSNSAGPAYPKTALLFFRGSVGVCGVN